MKYRIGVDIGGMSVKIGVVDSEFNLIEKLRFPTGEGCKLDDIIGGIERICRELIGKYDIECVGIGSPGQVDSKKGVILFAGNLPFRNEPIVEKLGKSLGVPVYVENDGTCALIGERACGACKGSDYAVIITIGTGIGGAIIVNGHVIRGSRLCGGELGHFVLDRNGEPCVCGLNGCFEQYASASALIEQTERAAQENPDSLLASMVKEELTGKTVFDAAEKGCEVAKSVLTEYGHILSDGINSLYHLFDPEIVVLSGGIANQGLTLLELVKPRVFPAVKVATTALSGNGGIIGAALLGTEFNV